MINLLYSLLFAMLGVIGLRWALRGARDTYRIARRCPTPMLRVAAEQAPDISMRRRTFVLRNLLVAGALGWFSYQCVAHAVRLAWIFWILQTDLNW